MTFGNNIAFANNRTDIDTHALVSFLELGEVICCVFVVEINKTFFFGLVVFDNDFFSVNVLNYTIALGYNLSARVFCYASLDTGTNNRSFRFDNRNCLTHHVRTHQRTVGVVVLQERDKRCSDRRNLVRSHVDKFNLLGRNNREVGILTSFNTFFDNSAVFVHLSRSLSHEFVVLVLSGHILHTLFREVYHAVYDLAVGSLDKSEVVNFCENAERRNKTDVRTFRSLDRAETSVVGIVYVAHLETCTVARKTAGA